ncbi:hypothetical protein [uncultured Roseivirga sp.]|uniref:hypothetical protein n=1 Tax=uncultured Roseivirga sp. TaxID=543088 RepID=UPI000D7A7079|nr:hypothetical protein [uncultured Roseivirga sp.]PWL30208.1 MAG: hypothetical protein DCO95_10280 [Roseivirga sp. XM-24bin3]
MSKSKRALIAMIVTSIIVLVGVFYLLMSDEGGWVRGFFSGFLTVAVLAIPFYIYFYIKEKKRENQSS